MKTPRIANAVGHINDELINSALKSKKAVKKKTLIKWTSFAACFAVAVIVAAAAVPKFFGDGNVSLPGGVEDTTVNSEMTQPELTKDDDSNENTPSGNRNSTVAATETSHSDNVKPTDILTDRTTVPVNSDSTTQPVTAHELAFSQAYFYSVSDGVFSTYVSGKVITEDKIGSKIDDVSVSAGWKNNADEWLTNETLRAEVYLINDISKDVAVALKFIDKGEALTTTHYYVIMNPDADLTAVKEYIIAPIAADKAGNEFGVETTVNETATEEFVVAYTSQFANK